MLKIWVVTDQRQFWRERWRCGCGKPTSFPGSLFLSQNNRSWERGWWQTRWCGKRYRKRLLKGSLRTVAWAAMFGSGFDKTFQFSTVNLWTSVAEGHAPFEKYKFAKSFLIRVALVCLNKVCFLLFFSSVLCSFIYRVWSPSESSLFLLPGDRDGAIAVLMAAKTYIPNEYSLYFNLGNMLGQKEAFQVSRFWKNLCETGN